MRNPPEWRTLSTGTRIDRREIPDMPVAVFIPLRKVRKDFDKKLGHRYADGSVAPYGEYRDE